MNVESKKLNRIEDGTTHVVWAIGQGPLYKLDGLNITSSFNVRTGMSRTRFIDIQVILFYKELAWEPAALLRELIVNLALGRKLQF